MKYLAAYLLLAQGGNDAPSAADIKTVVESVGIEADESRISELLADFEGKGSLDAIVAQGNTMLASVPSGGAGVAASTSAAAGGEAAVEEEEKEEEAKEESDDDMGFGLFD